MIVLICGGRNFTDVDLLFRTMDAQHAAAPISMVIEGGQRTYRDGQPVAGADLFAWNWAAARGVPCTTIKANWSDLSQPNARIRTSVGGRQYDANAGPRRNAAMLTMRPDRVIAFEGGKGTADMLRQARAAGIQTIEVKT